MRILLTVTLVLLGSCAATIPEYKGLHESKYASQVITNSDQLKTKLQEAKDLWEKRYKRDDLENALQLFEVLAVSIGNKTVEDINRAKLCEYLARGYYLLADAHSTEFSEQKRFWEVGAKWAEQGMILNDNFRKALETHGEITPALKYLTKKETGLTYWYLANIGKWAKNLGVTTALKYRDLMTKMAERVVQLDPKYFYAGMFRYWGAYYALAPNFAGGDLGLSYENFTKALHLAPNYLGTWVLMAEVYATKKGDKELYQDILQNVLRAKISPDSPIYPENFLEKEKAKHLWDNIENYF